MSIIQITVTVYNACENIFHLKVAASPYCVKNTLLHLHSLTVNLYEINEKGQLSNIFNNFFSLFFSPSINNTYANLWVAYP